MTDEGPPEADRGALLARLTPNERRCLELVDRGMNSKEIARELDRSPNSVDTWIRSAVRKLGVRNRFQAAKLVAGSQETAESGGITPLSILRYQDSHIPAADLSGDEGASAGKGNGPVDPGQDFAGRPVSQDSGKGRSWLEPSHPLAKFFGGENRLSWGQRLVVILLIAVAASIAFTAVMNNLLAISHLLSNSS